MSIKTGGTELCGTSVYKDSSLILNDRPNRHNPESFTFRLTRGGGFLDKYFSKYEYTRFLLKEHRYIIFLVFAGHHRIFK